jgi:hypothetical protein
VGCLHIVSSLGLGYSSRELQRSAAGGAWRKV